MILVVDASFAAKVLLRESGTPIAQRWWADDAVTWLAPTLIAAEVESAIAIHHRNNPDVFGARHRRLASAQWATMLEAIVLRTLDRPAADAAVRLIQDHQPLRGADACYLAVAEGLAADGSTEVVLGSFDRQQRRAADELGLAVTAES